MRVVGISVIFCSLFVALCMLVANTVPKRIQASIKSDLDQQYVLRDVKGINVSVDGRDVTLIGQVNSAQEINSVIKTASHRPGVRIVMTEITISEQSSDEQ